MQRIIDLENEIKELAYKIKLLRKKRDIRYWHYCWKTFLFSASLSGICAGLLLLGVSGVWGYCVAGVVIGIGVGLIFYFNFYVPYVQKFNNKIDNLVKLCREKQEDLYWELKKRNEIQKVVEENNK